MSPNPSGANQLGGAEPAYGAIKRLTELTREAPVSGAPVAGRALNAPRRAQKQAGRRPKQPATQPATPEQTVEAAIPAAQPDYGAQLASVYQQLVAVPGSEQFPVIGELANDAQRQTGGTR